MLICNKHTLLSLLSDASITVLAVAAALDLLLIGVSGLKTVLDGGALIAGVRRRWRYLRTTKEANQSVIVATEAAYDTTVLKDHAGPLLLDEQFDDLLLFPPPLCDTDGDAELDAILPTMMPDDAVEPADVPGDALSAAYATMRGGCEDLDNEFV